MNKFNNKITNTNFSKNATSNSKVTNSVNNFLDKTQTYIFSEDKTIASKKYLILIILVITLVFVSYFVYNYFFQSNTYDIKTASSYYGKNIQQSQPIFSQVAPSIIDCINMCETDLTCDGITYNNDTQFCTGTKDGTIRSENINYSAWVKPLNEVESNIQKIEKSILIGYANVTKYYDSKQIALPYNLGNFSFAFNLNIIDFHKNFGVWRHIFHKGTEIPTNTEMNYQSWENLIQDIPVQCIGVWLSPFNNNLRIAIYTTIVDNNNGSGSYKDAMVQECDCLTENCYITDLPGSKWADTSKLTDQSHPKTKLTNYLEYIDHDLQNIPLNRKFNLIVNIEDKYVEIYLNGKIIKTTNLTGTPNFTKSNLYVMNDKSFGGELSNLMYFPQPLKLTQVKEIISLNNINVNQ